MTLVNEDITFYFYFLIFQIVFQFKIINFSLKAYHVMANAIDRTTTFETIYTTIINTHIKQHR